MEEAQEEEEEGEEEEDEEETDDLEVIWGSVLDDLGTIWKAKLRSRGQMEPEWLGEGKKYFL